MSSSSVSPAAFSLCWSPYFLFDILDNFNILPETKERFYASVIIQNLPALNSAINPLIYCLFSNHLCTPFEYCPFTLTLTIPTGRERHISTGAELIPYFHPF